ncbi:MAG: hypothetical protein R2875_18535 [Desulfobacterales bacterium]
MLVIHIETIVLEEPGSAISEAYKAIRPVCCCLHQKDLRNHFDIQHEPGHRETVTSLNLAIALAQSEKKCCWWDADMRRSRIHKIFGLDNTRGLSNLSVRAKSGHYHDALGHTGIPGYRTGRTGAAKPV